MAPQTSYSRNPSAAFAGMLGGEAGRAIKSFANGESSAVPAGILMVHDSEDVAALPGGATELLAGAVINQFGRNPGDSNVTLSSTQAYAADALMPLLTTGEVWLTCEEAMAVGDDVYVRYAAGAGGSQLGAIRNDADTASARQVKGARVLVPSTGAGVCLVYLDVAADTAQIA